MSKTAKLILIGLLIVQNGHMLIRWTQEASQANDVALQWIRIIIPVVMIIQSLATILLVWVADRVVRKRRRKDIQPSAAAPSQATPQAGA